MILSEPNDTPILVRALRGEKTERTPVWLMRQAGRSDPKYLAFRQQHPEALEELFANAEKAAAITLLPARIGVDGLVIFQDILTPLTPAGAPFRFAPDPRLEHPMRSSEDLAALHAIDPVRDLAHQKQLFDLLKEQAGGLPLLGFAGAPLTLLAFLVEGQSFGHGIGHIQSLLKDAPRTAHAALGLLTEMTVDYLRFQIGCGAAAIQLFESAAGLFSSEDYRQFAIPYQREIFERLRGLAPTIHFAHFPEEAPPLSSLLAAGADVISLPASLSIAAVRREAGACIPVQGNVDNRLLAHGVWSEIEAATRRCLAEGANRGHVFNLGHGLLRETPHANVVNLVSLVRSISQAKQGEQ